MEIQVIGALRRLPRVSARRAIRVAIAGSGTFSFLYEVVHNPTAAFFAAFGSVVLLVYVEFGGPKRQRFEQHIGLIGLTFFFIFLGTLCSQVLWVAVVSSVIICFCISMAGVVSTTLAGATSAMLISFLLPVAFQGPLSTLPDRLLGWAVAGGLSLLAVVFILPAPSTDPLVDVTTKALDKLSDYVGIVAAPAQEEPPPDVSSSSAFGGAAQATSRLRNAFFATPFRPAGLSASARSLLKVIEWTLELDLLITGTYTQLDSRDDEVRALVLQCAKVLERSSVALTSLRADTTSLTHSLDELRAARARLEGSALRSLHRYETPGDSSPDPHDVELPKVLDESFRADNAASAVEKLGMEVLGLVAARRRTWWQQSLGLEAKGTDSRIDAARRRIRSHLSPRSVWLHNSARGAIGLGASVWVAYAFGLQHAFWVVFGTLAVLRSNALSTGQTVVKALTGTIEGIIIGSLVIAALGSHEVVFWILLPFAICFTGFAPSAISFAAGQAGFTMTVLILFNIVQPMGWTIGVVRIEDVALGCAVSLVVGLLFWPRGASSALGYSIADAIDESVRYLQSSVAYGLARCDTAVQEVEDPTVTRRLAQAAARRLDDTFREYLSERGSKSVSLADVSVLIAGVTAIRTTSDSIQELWVARDLTGSIDRPVVRRALTQATESVAHWYGELSDVVIGSRRSLSEPTDFDVSAQELVTTVRREFSDPEGNGTAVAFKIVWTDDYLRQLHQLQLRMLPVIVTIASTRTAPSRYLARRNHVRRHSSEVPQA